MDITPFFLPMIIIVGVATSYEDTRGRGIRNRWIVLSLAYSIAAMAIIVVWLLASGSDIIYGYFLDYAVNLTIALGFGFVLWKFRIWAAGDGKLFFAYASLIPLSSYSIGYVSVFPSFILFINSLVIAFFYVVAALIADTSCRKKIAAIKETLRPRSLAKAIISLFGLSSVVTYGLSLVGVNLGILGSSFLIPVIYLLVDRFPSKFTSAVYGSLFIAGLLIRTMNPYSDMLISIAITVVAYIMLNGFVMGLSRDFFQEEKGNSRMPFAVFLLVGALATIFLGGNAILSIKQFFGV
jgi:hypothetical protein